MNKERIEVGDIVHVDCNMAQMTLFHRGVVLGIPQDVGDSWKFKDFDMNRIIYVSEGLTIILLEKGKE